MTFYLQQFWQYARPADILDVVIAAVLIYVVLKWLRQRTSRALVLSTSLLALVYIAARWIGMYVTLLFFQTGLTVVLFALVVVFQEDLRGSFEKLSSWRLPSRKRRLEQWLNIIDTLVEAATALAKKRRGALIVIKGHDSLDHLVRGGVVLKGRLSIPVLLNIFYEGSPGHDGAIVIDFSRIEKFGAHLPLSRNLDKVGDHGTRHTAALGMAESSDALVLVVSEEQGTISVAVDNELYRVETTSELHERLTDYYKSKFAAKPISHWWQMVTMNLSLKVVSFGLACALWLAVAYQPEIVQRTVPEVSLEYLNLPEGWVIEKVDPPKIKVTLAGSQRAFTDFDEKEKKLKISLNMKRFPEGEQSITLKEQFLQLPQGLRISRWEPTSIKIVAYEHVTRSLQVDPIWSALKPNPKDFKVSIRPNQVEVEMRKTDQAKVKSIPTRPIPFFGNPDEFPVGLALPPVVTLTGQQSAEALVIVDARPKDGADKVKPFEQGK